MILLLGCATDDSLPTGIDLAAYAALDGDHAWTWRDDGGAEPPASEALVHGAYGVTLELRRGLRFEDGVPVGALGLAWEDGLYLRGWSVEDAGSDTEILLAEAGAAEGEVGDGCTLTRPDLLPTWYAAWDEAIVIACPSVSLGFASGFGLVWFAAEGATLDLVAPA